MDCSANGTDKTMKTNKTRGAANLPTQQGKVLERLAYEANQDLIAAVLNAERLDSFSGGSIDLISGIDAIATIENRQVGIALRCRRTDYHSLTLNRHITDPYSQVHSLLKTLDSELHYIAPAFIIQINGLDQENRGSGTLLRVNVRQFAKYLKLLIDRNLLQQFYNEQLKAYEFNEQTLEGSLSIAGFKRFCLQ